MMAMHDHAQPLLREQPLGPMLRRLPHNVDAEMAVLGAILVDNRAFERVSEFLRPEHFVLIEHRSIFSACRRLLDVGMPADPITLRGTLENDATPEVDAKYLFRLADCAVTPTVAASYGKLIADLADRRLLIAIGEETVDKAYVEDGDSPAEIVGHVTKALSIVAPTTAEAAFDDLADLAAHDFPPVRHHIAGLITDGLTLLSAKPKVGKSWMLLDMALAVAGGGCALESLRAAKGKALLLMLEDSPRRLHERTLAITSPASVPRGVTAVTAWRRGKPGIDDLNRYLDKHPGTTFLGVDVLARFREPVENGGGYQADYEAVAMLQELAQQRTIALVLLHHLRKADADDPVDLISGTLGIAGAADHLITITGNKEAGHKLMLRGRDLLDVDWDLRFEGGRWSIIGDTAKRRSLDKVERIELANNVRKMHAENPGLSEREIAASLGCSKTHVHNVLKEDR